MSILEDLWNCDNVSSIYLCLINLEGGMGVNCPESCQARNLSIWMLLSNAEGFEQLSDCSHLPSVGYFTCSSQSQVVPPKFTGWKVHGDTQAFKLADHPLFIAEVSTRHRERARGDVAGEIWGSAAQKEADAQGQHTVDTACPLHAIYRASTTHVWQTMFQVLSLLADMASFKCAYSDHLSCCRA